MKHTLRLCLFVCLVTALASFVFGQGERATITGNVIDASKAAVPDANVVLRNIATTSTPEPPPIPPVFIS